MSGSSQKVRVPNFTNSEKNNLMCIIVNKYAPILEDKKTDRISTTQKDKAWIAIEQEFNASSCNSTYKSAASLRKCYDNRKKELRKTLAEERKQTMLTGGGPPPKIKKKDTDDILLSILNKKTLFGLSNKFDDDADESLINSMKPVEDITIEYVVESDEEQESVHESMPNLCDSSVLKKKMSSAVQEQEHNTSLSLNERPSLNTAILTQNDWKKYTPMQLSTPINPALTFKEPQAERDMSNDKTPKKSNRRRPATVVKALTSSDVANKYNLLLDKRLELLSMELNHKKAENAQILRKLQNENDILDIELRLKKRMLEVDLPH